MEYYDKFSIVANYLLFHDARITVPLADLSVTLPLIHPQ